MIRLSIIVDTDTSNLAPTSAVSSNLKELLNQASTIQGSIELILASNEKVVPLPHGFKNFVFPNSGYYAMKNQAFKISKGQFALFLDSDCRLGKGYLELLFHKLEQDNDVICFCGRTEYDGSGFLTKVNSTLSFGYLFQPGLSTPYPYSILSHNVTIKKASFNNPPFGNFSGRVNGDRFLTDTCIRMGSPPILIQGLNIYHENPTYSIKLLVERHLREYLKAYHGWSEIIPLHKKGIRLYVKVFKSPWYRRRKLNKYGTHFSTSKRFIPLTWLIFVFYLLLDLASLLILVFIPILSKKMV